MLMVDDATVSMRRVSFGIFICVLEFCKSYDCSALCTKIEMYALQTDKKLPTAELWRCDNALV